MSLKRPFVLLSLCLLFVSTAFAANVKVNCNRKGEGEGSFSSITAALAHVNPAGPNMITVSGTCNENVSIQSFGRLALVANPGASVNDPSNGVADAILVVDSDHVSIQGFTINGGSRGIACVNYSLCRLSGNTVQNSAGDGVVVNRSRADMSGDTILNNINGRGLAVLNSGHVVAFGETIQGSGAAGVRVTDSSFLNMYGSTITKSGGNGIRVTDHSSIVSTDNSITGNAVSGISLEEGSVARLTVDVLGNTITGNGLNGVSVNDLSMANFEVAGNDISGNLTQPDVACNPQFSATRGALTNIGPGTTNCKEP